MLASYVEIINHSSRGMANAKNTRPPHPWNIGQIVRKIVVGEVGNAASLTKEGVEFGFNLCYLIAWMWR